MFKFGRKISADRFGGALFLILGVASLLESTRLRPLRIRDAVGDDTFPLILGVVLVILGGLMAFVLKPRPIQVTFPRGAIARRMAGSMASLFGYWAALPYLGYVPTTAICSLLLFRLFGAFRWMTCLLASALLTGSVYLVFVRFLKMPFPIGIFGL